LGHDPSQAAGPKFKPPKPPLLQKKKKKKKQMEKQNQESLATQNRRRLCRRPSSPYGKWEIRWCRRGLVQWLQETQIEEL